MCPQKWREQRKRYRQAKGEKIAEPKKRILGSQSGKNLRVSLEISTGEARETVTETENKISRSQPGEISRLSSEISRNQPRELREYRARYQEANREFMIRYREKRSKTFAETLQEQLRNVQRYQRETQQKLKALGCKRLSVVLTDCLKPPPRYPVRLAKMRSPDLMYLDSFCHSLSAEEDMSFDQMLEECQDVDINQQQQPTVLNLDSGQVGTIDEHVWDRDSRKWLLVDDLIQELDQEAELESLIHDVDLTSRKDFVEDTKESEWENVWNDVLDNFDLNLLK